MGPTLCSIRNSGPIDEAHVGIQYVCECCYVLITLLGASLVGTFSNRYYIVQPSQFNER